MKKIEDKTITGIFKNVIKAVLILLYFLIINILCLKVEYSVLQNYIKVVSVVLLWIAIYTFEKSYKKDNEFIFLEAVEYVVMLLHTLTIIYITNKYKIDLRKYVVLSAYIFAAYFVLKAIIIYTKSERDYAKSLSDIPEIVKKEEPKVKEATKKKKVNNDKEESNDFDKVEVKEGTENKGEVSKKVTKKNTTKKAESKTTNKASTKKTSTKKVTTAKTTKAKEKNVDKVEKKTTRKTTTNSTSKTAAKKTPTKKSATTTTKKTTKTAKPKTDSDDKKEVKEND